MARINFLDTSLPDVRGTIKASVADGNLTVRGTLYNICNPYARDLTLSDAPTASGHANLCNAGLVIIDPNTVVSGQVANPGYADLSDKLSISITTPVVNGTWTAYLGVAYDLTLTMEGEDLGDLADYLVRYAEIVITAGVLTSVTEYTSIPLIP